MKVVGIGFGKTGTSTLATCLRTLGFRHKTWDKKLYDACARGDMGPVDEALRTHDSFDDWPWPELYQRIDHLYPGSRFVLTLRKDVDTFLRSLQTHAERRSDKTRIWHIYGMAPGHFDAELARRRYLQHVEDVRAYFRDRPSDLLEVCWETGDGWERLTTFLGKPVPAELFPHTYGTPSRAEYARQERLRRLLPRFLRKGLGLGTTSRT